jgi:hypothetical protein
MEENVSLQYSKKGTKALGRSVLFLIAGVMSGYIEENITLWSGWITGTFVLLMFLSFFLFVMVCAGSSKGTFIGRGF